MSQPFESVPPPPPPPTVPPAMPPGGGAAAQQVQGPAIGLLATAILGSLLVIVSVIRQLFWQASAIPDVGNEQVARILALIVGPLGVVIGIVGVAIYAFIIWAALQMKKLRQWNLSVAASIAAMLPCSCCCLLGLPIGAWSLVVLMKPEVKAAFTK